MMLWEAKASSEASYTTMKTPSSYQLEWEDLDSNSYRSVITGNLNRSIVSKKWLKASFDFNYLTESEAETILSMINAYPLYARVKSPLFGTNGVLEAEFYVSKVSIEMQQNKSTGATWQHLSFNMIQSKKVGNQ